MPAEKPGNFNLPQKEEEILKFWEENKIFEKSVAQRKHARRFIFYDGPPFATGLPHYGHLLASTIKDVVPRYWTMKGFRVDRRWGWDCHGLPIENLVEEELGVSGRKAIEKIGIKKFNEAARSKVLTYASEWRKTVRRIGRFVGFENSYKTLDATYMESVWWAFAELYKKGLVYKDSRISLFCPRCETPLSNFEIAMDNSYRDQEDEAVYVKFPLKGVANEYLLIWTTTPWTLPGNAAVAVNPKLEYTKYKIGKELIWSLVLPPLVRDEKVAVMEKRPGKVLVGLEYQPPFRLTDEGDAYKIVEADFVEGQEGTGFVHIAPAFGEEDFDVGKKEKLPVLDTLDDTGRFTDKFPALKFLASQKTKEANPLIVQKLKTSGFLWNAKKITHRYPICWRCRTSLIYKIQPAWFIKISALRPKLLALNESINWHPEHLKHGRFGKGLETAPDWNVSRSRFWGTPMPVWECKQCSLIHVVGSRKDLNKKRRKAQNQYFIMRHGEAENNAKDLYNTAWPETKKYHLTNKGKQQVKQSALKLKKEKIDFIYASPFTRAKETAEIAARVLGVKIRYDERLREMAFGAKGDVPVDKSHSSPDYLKELFTHALPGGETFPQVRARVWSFLQELEKDYQGKKILMVGHGDPLWMLYAAAQGWSNDEALLLPIGKFKSLPLGEVVGMEYHNVPRNDTGEGDLHRPYVDEVSLVCKCGSEARRIPDVFDCWFESGSMPFAEKHYPFENKKLFENNFPADFVAEYIAQTRGWFYTLHVLAAALFSRPAFKHAVTTGTILSEKGEKLSKSRKNFPDPWLLFDCYGADAMRYYLMSSPVMQADNINFSEADVDEIYKKYSLITGNVLSFFKLYKFKLKKNAPEVATRHVLDKWILSRLHSTLGVVTAAFDSYEIVSASRPPLEFVQDLSLWYVRRSRERIKAGGVSARGFLITLQEVLYKFSLLMAPLTPFLAEIIYQEIGCGRKKSVHLEDWPRIKRGLIDKKLEKLMDVTRGAVSSALRARAEVGIKVRQPLPELRITNKELRNKQTLLELIKDEVNVKEITFGSEMKLDTTITPELKEEGMLREIIRNIQEMRRDLGLKPQDFIQCDFSGAKMLQDFLRKKESRVKKEIRAKAILFESQAKFSAKRELDFDGERIIIGVGL